MLDYKRLMRKDLLEDPYGKSFLKLVYKKLHYQILKTVPRVLSLSDKTEDKLFYQFMQWADESKMNIDWAVHIHLLNWLYEHDVYCKYIDNTMIKELLIAAVRRWALLGMEYFDKNHLLVISKHMPDKIICLSKSNKADENAKVRIFVNPHVVVTNDCYAILSDTLIKPLKDIKWIELKDRVQYYPPF